MVNFTIWVTSLRHRFSEFDTFLTSFAIFVCIAGLFTCIWCTCCGHEDSLLSLDQRRLVFYQDAKKRAAINRSSNWRKRKRFRRNKEPLPPDTWIWRISIHIRWKYNSHDRPLFLINSFPLPVSLVHISFVSVFKETSCKLLFAVNPCDSR